MYVWWYFCSLRLESRYGNTLSSIVELTNIYTIHHGTVICHSSFHCLCVHNINYDIMLLMHTYTVWICVCYPNIIIIYLCIFQIIGSSFASRLSLYNIWFTIGTECRLLLNVIFIHTHYTINIWFYTEITVKPLLTCRNRPIKSLRTVSFTRLQNTFLICPGRFITVRQWSLSVDASM